MEYRIVVDAYEGPLDLLLSLIKQAEIDIYDIPINVITEQFLDYIAQMEDLNLDVTSEFLVMASTLLEIKSKMLLPKEKIIQDGIEVEVDPREELVKRLLEYKLYKEAAENLKASEAIESKAYYKPQEDLSEYTNDDDLFGELDLDSLVKAISNIIYRKGINSNLIDIGEITREEYTLDMCIENIRFKLKSFFRIKFTDLINYSTKEEIITYFLSLLELTRLKEVFVYQNEAFSDIIIEKRIDGVVDNG